MQTTTHEFRLGFVTNQNAVASINIPRANPGAEAAQIADAMQAMIGSNVLQWNTGEALFRHSANLVTIGRREITITN